LIAHNYELAAQPPIEYRFTMMIRDLTAADPSPAHEPDPPPLTHPRLTWAALGVATSATVVLIAFGDGPTCRDDRSIMIGDAVLIAGCEPSRQSESTRKLALTRRTTDPPKDQPPLLPR
jgi:hypothetical protein